MGRKVHYKEMEPHSIFRASPTSKKVWICLENTFLDDEISEKYILIGGITENNTTTKIKKMLGGDKDIKTLLSQNEIDRISDKIEIALEKFKIQKTTFVEELDKLAFPEGKEKFRIHKSKERNRKLVSLAKTRHLQNDKRFSCQACGFSFKEKYGKIGEGFIEAHHIFPISELKKETDTKIDDLILVCSNCHRILHRKRPWLTLDELRIIINENHRN